MNNRITTEIKPRSYWHRCNSLGGTTSTAEGGCVYLHGILVAVPDPTEDVFSLPCPPDGATRQGDHAQALLNPFAPGHLSIHVHPFLCCPACRNQGVGDAGGCEHPRCNFLWSSADNRHCCVLLLHTKEGDSHKRTASRRTLCCMHDSFIIVSMLDLCRVVLISFSTADIQTSTAPSITTGVPKSNASPCKTDTSQ